MQVFMYRVPPLDFEEEDINVEFQLTTISGNTPIMAVSFCEEEDYKRCADGVIRSYVLDTTGSFR